MLWVCVGGAAQLIVVSRLWSWLPSFLNRVHGIAPARPAVKAALVVLAGALGSVVWGAVVDRAGRRAPARKLAVMALLCIVSLLLIGFAFGADRLGVALGADAQFALIVVGGFVATCTVGPVSAIVIDVIHPGVRATGSSVLALFQNLFGLAAGPFLAGVLSDAWGLTAALSAIPAFGVVAALAFLHAGRSYEADKANAGELSAAPVAGTPAAGLIQAHRTGTKDIMNGLMMQQPLLISSLLTHAERHHGEREVVSRRVEGDLHRTTYRELARRSRRMANALAAHGIGFGDRVATLAWNGYRHMELYYAVSGSGAVLHTLNPRLHPDQVVWIADHAEDQVLFFDLTFLPLIEAIASRVRRSRPSSR
jgi:MFS family permease